MEVAFSIFLILVMDIISLPFLILGFACLRGIGWYLKRRKELLNEVGKIDTADAFLELRWRYLKLRFSFGLVSLILLLITIILIALALLMIWRASTFIRVR